MRSVGILLFFVSFWAFGQQKPAAALPVKAVPAKLARAVLETGAVGSLRADEAVVIRPEIAGRIERIAFDEGQSVKKGALLVTLDAAETRALVASSRAQAGLDKQRFERAADLKKKGFISQQALDELQSAYTRSLAKQREDEA
ncbi:MAG TPA: biotin/lipoyl-binding protein, partial [Burkholderiales bacterium]|nr:biotin/lipoyl-binding protein [Burkholderiales bacterium]